MKKIACEMCGSNDLIKQEGNFICQHCGMKYSTEEVKKMMIEGTVDVQGTVKIDNTAVAERHLQNARRAKSKEDWAEVEKYYNLAEQEDPTNIEAIFYSAFGKAKQSLIDADLFKRQAAFKVLNKSVSIIDDNFDISKEDEQLALVNQILSDVKNMRGSSFVYNTTKTTKNGVTTTSDDKAKTYELFDALNKEMLVTLENLEKKLTKKNNKISVLKYLISAVEAMTLSDATVSLIESYYKKWHSLDSGLKYEDKMEELRVKLKAKKRKDAIVGGIILGVVVGIAVIFILMCI